MKADHIDDERKVDDACSKILANAEASGYHLNPDTQFVRELVEGLITNEERYGYPSCPCRLASGNKAGDLDIICPCDYRDPDLRECGTCFCALYVSEKVLKGTQIPCSIPERRPAAEMKKEASPGPSPEILSHTLSYPVWRCKVCGYLCAREEPPGTCPICKAQKERFERFL